VGQGQCQGKLPEGRGRGVQGASDGDRGEASQAGREWVLRRERGVLAANGMGEGVEEEEVSHRTAVMQMHVARPPNRAGLAESAFASLATSKLPFSSFVAIAGGVLPRAFPHIPWPLPG